MNSDNDNDQDGGDAPAIFIIIGQVSQETGGDMVPIHVMLAAPDEDTAVRLCLDAQGMPDEEPHASAYQGALEGEVAIINFDRSANRR